MESFEGGLKKRKNFKWRIDKCSGKDYTAIAKKR